MKRVLHKLFFILAFSTMPLTSYALEMHEIVGFIEQSSDDQFLLNMISMTRSLPVFSQEDLENLRNVGASEAILDALVKRSQELRGLPESPAPSLLGIQDNPSVATNTETSTKPEDPSTIDDKNTNTSPEIQNNNEAGEPNTQTLAITETLSTPVPAYMTQSDYMTQIDAVQKSNLSQVLDEFYRVAKQNYEINAEVHKKFSALQDGHEKTQAANSELPRIRKILDIVQQNPEDALQQCLFIESQTNPVEHSEAYVEIHRCLGLAFYELKLYSLAAARLDVVIQHNVKSPDFPEILQKFRESSKLSNYISASPTEWKKQLEDVPKSERDDFLYTMAYAYLFGESAQPEIARQLLLHIGGNKGLSQWKAMYLIASYEVDPALNKFKSASRKLEKVILDTQDRTDSESYKLHHLATLLLARIAFENSDFLNAARLYLRVPVQSHHFRTAVIEAAWANIFGQAYAKALALTHILYSPSFSEDYFPDLHLIEAMAYFKLCHFDAALNALEQFREEYLTLRDDLQKFMAMTPSREFYAQMVQKAKNPELSLIPNRIYKALLANHEFYTIHQTLSQILKEQEVLQKLASPKLPQIQNLLEELQVRLNRIKNSSSITISRIFNDLIHDLSNLEITSTEISIEIKLALREREEWCLQRAAQGKECEFKTSAPSTTHAPKEKLRWEFEGEFWRDELLQYVSHIDSVCIDLNSKQQ